MSLVPRFILGALDLTEFPFAVEFGSDFGDPDNVSDVINSLLADGEIELSSRRGNRSFMIPVLIDDSDLLALAEAEALLTAECDKPQNTFTVDPGDGIAPSTVFQTFRATARFKRSDDEEQAGVRRYEVSFRALPFGRSVSKIVDNAGTPPSTGGTLLLNCESTTGWATLSTSGTPEYVVDSTLYAQGAGSIRSKAQVVDYRTETGYSTYYSQDSVSGLSLSTGTGGYLSFAIRFDLGGEAVDHVWMTSTTGGTQEITSSLMAVKRDANGFVHYVWPVAAGLTITGFAFSVHQGKFSSLGDPAYVRYDDFELYPSATADHQIVKQHDVKGSARTTGSLHIAAPTDSVALGQVLAITTPTSEVPAGFQPDGRRWVTQGTTTADATSPDGSYYTPDAVTYSTAAGKPIFDVPASMLTPGPYTIVALVKTASSPLVTGVRSQLLIGSTVTGPTSEAEVSVPTSLTGWQFVTVGTVYLPPTPMQGADATTKVRLLFKGALLSNVYMIPAWQVGGSPVADFSIVDCGSGTVSASGASSNLWIDSPSTDQPQGGWWRGPTSDRLNARSAWPDAKKPGIHTFRPGPLLNFLVSVGAQGPTSALEYYPAWPNAAAL